MRSRYGGRAGHRGQILVIFVAGLLALIAGVAFVVDGGNALAQQRGTQNGTDAAAEAGTVIVAQYLMAGLPPTGTPGSCPGTTTDAWDLEVCKAVYASASVNGITVTSAQYVDYQGTVLGPVGAGPMPTGAQGVRVNATRQFNTYFAAAVGIPTFSTSTQGTAATYSTQPCTPGMPCALFPITVPYIVSTCDNSGMLNPGSGDWPYLGSTELTAANEAIVPLCKDKNDDIGGGSAGSVGWIDYSTAIGVTTVGTCPSQFKDAVISPCVASLPFQTWVQTFAGGIGKGGPTIESTLNQYHDDTVQVPLFDGTCKVKPAGTAKADCPVDQIGVGTNTWYHIPSFANFKLDYFYVAGNDQKLCGQLPGQPLMDSNGSNGCMKGWWVKALTSPGTIQVAAVSQNADNNLGVVLIR